MACKTAFLQFVEVDQMIENEIEPELPKYIKSEDLLLKHFDFLWPLAYPKRGKRNKDSHRITVRDGAWSNLGSLLEHAISVQGNLGKLNGIGKDFIDISDAKLVSVRTYSCGKSYGAPVTNIHRKRGLLRVVCYERKVDKFYFFVIPYSAYKHIAKTSNIEIPFNLDGSPRRINNCKVDWWQYEKYSFKEICVAEPTQSSISSQEPDSSASTKNHPNLQIAIPCIPENDQSEILGSLDILPICLSD